jgi:hypothetical protein
VRLADQGDAEDRNPAPLQSIQRQEVRSAESSARRRTAAVSVSPSNPACMGFQ